jgi:probable phosphoglycerate mutase
MSTFYLIRHATTDYVGDAIAGWLPGVHLNDKGREEAQALAARLSACGITRLVSSPLERALETAAAISRTLNLPVETREALGEVRFGDWTGTRFTALENDREWKRFNSYRSATRAPGGELMLESQARMVAELDCLARKYAGETMAVVSHGDIIRSALLYYLGMPMDFYARIEISPASFSVVELNEWSPRVLLLNGR